MPLTGVPEFRPGGCRLWRPRCRGQCNSSSALRQLLLVIGPMSVTRLQEIESAMVLLSKNAIFVPLSTFGNQQSCFVNDTWMLVFTCGTYRYIQLWL